MTCDWCRSELRATRPEQRFCGKRCRQAAYRLRRQSATAKAQGRPMVFGYADPPYPGRAAKYYKGEELCAEVDHAQLVAELERDYPDGWALSTAADALHEVLPLCPAGARVCAWVKPIGASTRTHGIHNTWEPVIVVRGRQRRPGVRDWLSAQPARYGGELPGRKPLAFCAWLFSLLGAAPGDTLVDLFPGTGIVGRAFRELSLGAPGDASPADRGDAPAEALRDTSPEYSSDPGSSA